MSDNPFASPTGTSPVAPNQQKEKPGALTAVAVISLILGIMGIMGFCFAFGGLAFQSAMEQIIESMPDDSNKDFQLKNIESQQSLMIPSLILAGVNLFIALGLIVGSIGVFSLKEKSRGILRTSLLAAAIYNILKLVLVAISTYLSFSVMSEVLNNAEFANPAEAQAVKTSMIGGATVGVLVSVSFAIAMLAYYFWAASYLKKPNVVALFK